MTRVVITGMGAVAPNGNGIQEFISNSFAGKVGIKAIKKFDAKPTGITVAGEIDDFDPNDVIGKKAAHRMDLYSQYALQSAIEAMEMAEINETNTKPVDMGVIYGSGIGGLTTIQEQIIKMHDKGPKRVSPMFVPMSIANMAAGNISIHFNAGGGQGVEVYTYKGRQFTDALEVCANISALGFKNRGVKDGSGLYVVHKTKAKSMLIECCFVDTEDANKYKQLGAQKLAEAIYNAIVDTNSVAPSPQPTPNPGQNKYAVGQKVRFSTCYKSSTAPNSEAILATNMARNYGIITKIKNGTKNPYLLDDGLCWVNDGDIREVLGAGTTNQVNYYPATNSKSIVDGLKAIGVDSSISHRKLIARVNGIANYSGTASQNEQLCSLLRQGKLIKA